MTKAADAQPRIIIVAIFVPTVIGSGVGRLPYSSAGVKIDLAMAIDMRLRQYLVPFAPHRV